MTGTVDQPGSPLPSTQRQDLLDLLRGVAVLGILVMNMQAFAMPLAAYSNPYALGELDGASRLLWLFGHLFADQKMMALFSALFGAGVVLFAERAQAQGRAPVALHYRRMAWLLLFGLAHAYLLWFGDILVLYAVCGAVVFWCRGWAPRTLLMVGIVLLAVASVLFGVIGWSLQFMAPADVAAMVDESWRPSADTLAAEVAAYRGGWLTQMAYRAPTALEFQTFMLAIWGFWRAAGMMLIGMALYKWGVLSGRCEARVYIVLVVVAVLIGLPLVALGVYWNDRLGWAFESMFLGSQFNYWGSVLVMLGWVGAWALVHRRRALTGARLRLAAVGRMAFSNYIAQTLICTSVFYGHGLGWFASVGRPGQAALVLAIWLLQLWWSPLWLRRYRYGPLEWLWRSLTYGRWQPLPRD